MQLLPSKSGIAEKYATPLISPKGYSSVTWWPRMANLDTQFSDPVPLEIQENHIILENPFAANAMYDSVSWVSSSQ